MPIRFDLAHGILVAAIVYDLGVTLRNKTRFKQILEDQALLESELEKVRSQRNYLVSMIDRHEIPVDPFDLIALTNPM